MSFNPNIPLPTDFLSQSQQDILTNFQTSDTSQGVNHYQFSDVTANNGKHKFLQMPENAAPTTAVDEGAVYTTVGSGPAETNLWFRAEDSGGGGGFEYQLTRVDAANSARFGKTSSTLPNGWTFLPGGLIYQWGRVLNPGSTGTVTFATNNISFPTTCFNLQLTSRHTDTNHSAFIAYTVELTNLIFRYRVSVSSTTELYWVALGY